MAKGLMGFHVNLQQFLGPAKAVWKNAKGGEVLTAAALIYLGITVWSNLAARGYVPAFPLPIPTPYIG